MPNVCDYVFEPFGKQLVSYILMIAVICAAATAQAPCRTNEVLVACSHPDSLCGNPVPMFCSLICGPKACRCRPGFARNAAGQCVANGLCRPKPPSKSVIPTCKANEDFVLCSRPEATCANPKPQPTPIGPPKCQCTGGFVRRLGVNCIPFDQCPTTPTPSTVTPCDAGWTLFQQACYRVSSSYASHAAAKVDCAHNGAHLVTITDKKEHDFVRHLMASSASNCASGPADACQMWLGLERIGVNDRFKWVDDTPYVFKNWRNSEPSNSNCNEFCVELHDTGGWNDNDCDPNRIWMCEKPANFGHSG